MTSNLITNRSHYSCRFENKLNSFRRFRFLIFINASIPGIEIRWFRSLRHQKKKKNRWSTKLVMRADSQSIICLFIHPNIILNVDLFSFWTDVFKREWFWFIFDFSHHFVVSFLNEATQVISICIQFSNWICSSIL